MALFKGVVKDRTNADIGWMQNRSPFYINGYRIAAEKLSENFGQLSTHEKDSLIFPIVYLYRQHIELAIKDIIRDICGLVKFKEVIKLDNHDILKLWDKIILLYMELEKQISPELSFTNENELKRARLVIKEFSNYDSQSFSFRYATDKSGNRLLDDMDYISLSNFRKEIEVVLKTIDNLIETICHEIEFQSYTL